MRLSPVGLAIALFALPGLADAQVAIEHQDVACIVVGKFPVLDACFRPGPDLARARVFFRPEGVPNWYYVEASAPAPPKADDPADRLCRRATLPKPKKVLLKKHVEYYVEATGKRLETLQTETYRPLVVQSESECKTRVVAPFVPTATVQVFPALPAAFAAGGGISGAAVAAVVGAGVAGGAGAVVAATTGGGATTAPPATAPPTTAPPATQPPTTTTTTTLPPVGFNPVFKVFRGGVQETGSKITGTEPVQLRFAMCESTGPLPLHFRVLVNGGVAAVGCDTTITFTAGGFKAGFASVAASGRVRSAALPAATYDILMRIQSDGPGNDPKASQGLVLEVDSVPPPTTTTTVPADPCLTDTTPPSSTVLEPLPGAVFDEGRDGSYIVPFRTSATDLNGVAHVEYKFDVTARIPGFGSLGVLKVSPLITGGVDFPFSWPLDPDVKSFLGQDCEASGVVIATVTDTCGNFIDQRNAGTLTVRQVACSTGIPFSGRPGEAGSQAQAPGQQAATWVSQLDVAGSRGQVVVNGRSAFFPPSGRAVVPIRLQAGENRVEATLVQAGSQPGLWRFEMGGERSFMPGSLRVVAGQVTQITQDAVVFRIKGRPGERVVFTFRSRR